MLSRSKTYKCIGKYWVGELSPPEWLRVGPGVTNCGNPTIK